MEKIKSHIHMEQIKCAEKMQFVIEEDKIIPDQSPDIKKLLIEDSKIMVEEIHPGTNFVQVKGKLSYQILYLTEEENKKLYKMAGEVVWEEKIHIDGMEPTDEVSVEVYREDMKVICSNARKITMKILVSLEASAVQLKDEDIILSMEKEGMEQKKEKIVFPNLVVKKKERICMKEETELPKTLPSIEQILWKSLKLNRWEIKPLEDNIVIGLEATMFVLYRSLGEEDNIQSFEATLKHNTNLECVGSHPKMWESTKPGIESYEINVKQDSDGEDRILEAEICLSPEILLYEEKELEMVTDVYGVREEIVPVYRRGIVPGQEEKQTVKLRINKVIRIPASYPGILQICHVKTEQIRPETVEDEEGITIQGSIPLKILYQSEKEEEAYCAIGEEISYQYRLSKEKVGGNYRVYGTIQQCNTVLLDREEIELKLVLMLEVQCMKQEEREYLQEVEVKELTAEQRKGLPSMAVYRAMEEENLWEVGKRYFVSIENIKRMNQMEDGMIKAGQKILLVR